MSFVRIWVIEGDVFLVNSSEGPIDQDIVTIPGATVYDGEVDGEFMMADQVMAALTITPEAFSVAGRQVSNMSVSVRPGSLPTAAEKLAAERERMVVSRFQAKAALSAAGLLPQVETAIAAADPVAQLAWAEAIEFKRNSPTIVGLAAAIGLTETQVDDLFRTAAGIEA